MRIDWHPDNRPDAAERIASHTQAVVRSMDEATTARQVAELFDGWWSFARTHRVCRPICEMMIAKRATLTGHLDKAPPARPRVNLTARMTGDRE